MRENEREEKGWCIVTADEWGAEMVKMCIRDSFSGDKVSEDNEIPVSAILLPDFSRMTEKDSLNAPAMHISETDIDLSIPLIKKNKVSHDILIRCV